MPVEFDLFFAEITATTLKHIVQPLKLFCEK